MVKILTFLIKAYKSVSQAILPRTCRFTPTCSSYAQAAVEKYGILKGSYKALIRIFRCSPLSKGGYDPLN